MRFIRAGLLVLAFGQLGTGAWALIAPADFYEVFPGTGSAWVAADGPFNHHLVIDAGAGFAATGVALFLAAMLPSRSARMVALVAYLIHALPHGAYHVRHVPESLSSMQQAMTWIPLATGLLLTIAMLIGLSRRSRPSRMVLEDAPHSPNIEGIKGWPRNPVLLAAFAVARRRLGTVPAAWRVTARVPRVAVARAIGDAAHQRTKFVPKRLGALVTLRASTVVECQFCIDIGSAVAAMYGVNHEQIRQLNHWREASVFDDDERLALELAEAMSQTPVVIPEGLVTTLLGHFGPEGVIELATTIGHENARARTNRVLGVPPQGFAPAASCPLPEPARSPAG